MTSNPIFRFTSPKTRKKIKQAIKTIFGESIARWLHAFWFVILIQTHQLNTEIEMLLAPMFVMPGSLAIDVGANSGNWTKILSDLVGKKGVVFAFEADPYYAMVTERTIRLLGLRNVIFFPFGLSDKDETLPLEIIDDNGQRVSGTGHIVEAGNGAAERTIFVNLKSLDELVSRYPQLRTVRLLKLDVEGFEMKVINGAKVLIQSARPVVIAEVVNSDVKGDEENNIFSFFNDLDYDAYVTVSKDCLRHSDHPGNPPEGERPNRIFIPREYLLDGIVQVEPEK